jgi:hypothetical protein
MDENVQYLVDLKHKDNNNKTKHVNNHREDVLSQQVSSEKQEQNMQSHQQSKQTTKETITSNTL